MNGFSPARRPRRTGVILTLLAALMVSGVGYSAIRMPQSAFGQPVIFGDGLLPAPGDTVPAGAVVVGCTVNSALAIGSVQLTVDGVTVPGSLSADGPPWQVRGTANVQAGTHQAAVTVTDSAGQSGGWTWQFTVAPAAPAPSDTPAPPAATPTPLPTPPPGSLGPSVWPMDPAPGWVVPEGMQRIAGLFGTDSRWRSQEMTLDGRPLTLQAEGAAAGTTVFAAQVPVASGPHLVVATGTDVYGRQGTAQWTFLASGPAAGGDLRITPLAPLPGATLSSGPSVRVAVRVETSATLRAPTLMIDGRPLTAPGGADPGRDTIVADAGPVAAGQHSLRFQAVDAAGHSHAVAWSFYVGFPPQAPDQVYYPQTGYSVIGPFQQYWGSLGPNALQLLGLPISGLLVERLGDGHDYTVQYFERVRLEWHPENRGSEFEVLYGLLGTQFHKPDPPIAKPAARPGTQFFPQTGHVVRGPFLQTWQSTGGLRVHGYPISEEIQEVSSVDGRVYLVQYFQRARFEYHPENAGTPFEILLGTLGRQLYGLRYPAP